MLNLQLARKYSKAMFELAQEEGKLIPFGDELASVKKDLASAPQLKGYLANPQIQRQDKKELLRKLFEGELSGTVLNFLYLLVDKRRIEREAREEAKRLREQERARGEREARALIDQAQEQAGDYFDLRREVDRYHRLEDRYPEIFAQIEEREARRKGLEIDFETEVSLDD